MRLLIILSLFVTSLLACERNFTLEISRDVHKSKDAPFLKHSGPGEFDSYLILNLPFEPVKQVYKSLEAKLQNTLTNRGEAHITVITPPEYYHQLRDFISIEEINKIAQAMNIQNSRFNILCIGKGEKVIEKKKEQTYYIVVESLDLLAIRKKIWSVYVEKGGDPKKFNPQKYYPHITLGFTKRDLHESDGIVKDSSSLFAYLVEKQESNTKHP